MPASTCSVSQACAASTSRVAGTSVSGGRAVAKEPFEVLTAGPVGAPTEVYASDGEDVEHDVGGRSDRVAVEGMAGGGVMRRCKAVKSRRPAW